MIVVYLIICLVILSTILFLSVRLHQNQKEFKINPYLKMRLEGGRSMIYVNGRPFRQCMYLLLNIPIDKIEEYDEIRSIDEAAVKLNRKMERNHRIVPPETEFWGHCSNLQAWADNDYDTRILHRNLAFPLLKALSDAGDPIARRKFKEEIAMRYATGHPTVVRFLTQNGYLHYLSEDEFESILIDVDFPSIDEFSRKLSLSLRELNNPDSRKQAKYLTSRFLNNFRFSYKYLMLLKAMEKIPEDLRQKYSEIVYDKYKNYSSFPLLKFLDKVQINFEDLDFKIVKYHDRLIGLLLGNKLKLRNKMITKISDINGINEICDNIEELDLSYNRITRISGLDILENLRRLNLKSNYIRKIEGVEENKKLEFLDLSDNVEIREIPDFLNDLSLLKTVKLTNCRISSFSDSVSRFFWMGQNFRYYTETTKEDIFYYENTHKSKAGINGRFYKNFIRWLFKLRYQMQQFNFDYHDIKKFERKTNQSAVHSGKLLKSFLKYLDDRKQTKITHFLQKRLA